MFYMGGSKNNGTPKSSILIGFSIIFTIHFGMPLFLETSISNPLDLVVGSQAGIPPLTLGAMQEASHLGQTIATH